MSSDAVSEFNSKAWYHMSKIMREKIKKNRGLENSIAAS